MTATPTRAKKRLGKFLRALRERAGTPLTAAAKELRTKDSTASRYESGAYRPQWPTVAALLTLYGATEEEWAKAGALWEDASEPTPQIRLPAGAPKVFRELVRAEREAESVRSIAPSVVPGLLQTADYARAVHASAQRSRDPAANVEDFVAARMSRQTLLEGSEPLRLHALLDEGVLTRLVGGATVMRAQLEHLLAVGERPTITLRVVPFAVGAYGSMSGACTILSYESDDDPPVAYLEHPAGGVWVENSEDVQHFLAMFDGVSDIALMPKDTARLIRARVRELKRS